MVLIQSCGMSDFGEWDLSGLSVLRIEGSSNVIYKYSAWGGLDSHAFGYRLMDSTKTFEVDVRADLPFNKLISIPNKNKISGLKHECEKSCGEYYEKAIPNYQPIQIKKTVKLDIEIENLIYQYKGYSKKSNGFGRFQFESFIETRDSLFFYNLDDVKRKNGQHLDNLKIKKCMVDIQNSNDRNEVALIVIETIEIDESNKKLTSYKTYHLRPKNKIKINEFSDYGIFKPARMKNTPSRG